MEHSHNQNIISLFINFLFVKFITSMSVTALFQRKLRLDLKLVHILERKPLLKVSLQPIQPHDFELSFESEWSTDNMALYQLVLEHGMAQHICNKQFLYQFYRSLQFENQGLKIIDQKCLLLKNIRVLNLTNNNIQILQMIPSQCKELYLDFNRINQIDSKKVTSLELLSLSNNFINDQCLEIITNKYPQLRCLNVSWNQIINLKQFVNNLALLHKLKILLAYGNPISMLAIYYSYVTDHIILSYIDGEKYVKVEPKKIEEPPKQVEQVKEEKKDNKKDNKKGAKVEEKKPIEEPPPVQLPKEEPRKELTDDDFEKVRIKVQVGNLEQFQGNTFDLALFPADIDVNLTQTTYWVKCYFMGDTFQQKEKAIGIDNVTIENQETRLNMDFLFQKEFNVCFNNFVNFNKGLKLEIHQKEPKMVKEAETLENKPEIVQNQVVMAESILGSTFIDLRQMHRLKKKQITGKFRLFQPQVVNNPLFCDPFQNEDEIVSKNKDRFEQQLKKLEAERAKQAQEQEQLRQQKKGKDQKKGGDKKGGKKEGKEVEKRKSERCDFPVDVKEYCAIEQNKISKGRSFLCIRTNIS